jgi:hypothetical protein
MHCIALRDMIGHIGSWEGRISAEMLGYHQGDGAGEKGRVEILVLLLLKNRRPNNYLTVLHPGNSSCEVDIPWTSERGLAWIPTHPL